MVATETPRRVLGAHRTGPTRVRPPRDTWRYTIPGVRLTTAKEGREIFDYQASKTLGISGEEFLRRWDAGEYRHVEDFDEAHKIDRLVMLMPFARRTPA